MTEVCSAGFPHSDISGSLDICSSPKLFAAYHVFHRLLVPRHPPYALSSITNLLRPRVWTPLHISSVICVGNSLLFLFVFSNQFSFLLLQASMITSDVLIFFLSFHFCMRFSRYIKMQGSHLSFFDFDCFISHQKAKSFQFSDHW